MTTPVLPMGPSPQRLNQRYDILVHTTTERFCERVFPAVENRARAHDHLDTDVQRRACTLIASRLYDFPPLAEPFVASWHKNKVEMASHKTSYPEYPTIILGTPVTRMTAPTASVIRLFIRYFALLHSDLTATEIRQRIDHDSIIHYGGHARGQQRLSDCYGRQEETLGHSHPTTGSPP
ncbi:hypothetical protein FRC07_000430 [Ceratobasidium sp. 392]|nr:hypothetical protein FRC07_000430 [Ceratobasidium sp. 392]